MSNLISDTAQEIYQKIELFSEYDTSEFYEDESYSWITGGTISKYHTECQDLLTEQYDSIVGDISSIDSNDSTSIALGPVDEDEFVMQPEDLDLYLAQGLTYEKAVEDDFFGQYSIPDISMTVDGGGDIITFDFGTISVTNNRIHPFPFTSMELSITMQMEYRSSNLYDDGSFPCTITINDMYRGPADNIGDRGQNYYDPINIVATSIDGMDAGNYLRRDGDIWDLDTQEFEITATFDNGAIATFNIYLPFTLEFVGGKITSAVPVESNGSYIDFQGSLTQPAYQWSDFTQTQSPNVLRAIEALQTNAASPKTNLFIEVICDSITDIWPDIIAAINNGDQLDLADIVSNVNADLYDNKTVALAQDTSIIKRYAKTYLANRLFEANAKYALELLNIDIDPSVTMSVSELSALNDVLILAGVTTFEEASGYYNWSNIPNCNSKDECARFATALFNNIKDFDEIMEHPTLLWISNNYDYIETEIYAVKTQLNKVI